MREHVATRMAFWGVVFAVLLPVLRANAQDSDPEEYKTRLERAMQVYNTETLDRALVAYLEVRAKFSGPEVDYSLARVYHKLYQCEDAQTFYLFVMNLYDLPEDHDFFAKAANHYGSILNCDTYARVTVECQPATANLSINGEPVGQCLSRPYRFPEGTYILRLDANGETSEESVRVSASQEKTVSLKIEEKVVEKIVEVPGPAVGSTQTNWLAWGLIGGSALSLTASGLFNAAGYSALVDVQKAADRGDASGRLSAEDDVSSNQMLTGITLGLGIAAAGTGAVLLILDGMQEEETPSGGIEVGFCATPENASLMFGTTF
ncbi:MAG: hypothetical protein COW42_00475 [Deltaproteobacteria bacterium CG17_big_fil_post_rev_8_21_14_2_50_63_7]|nr:MAG: hypothetical protein COW42_00475 [Deltaproteobacteria bacterium CG17_big_fil_post_rev_8_21_14_2_50_63_7]